MVTSPAMDGPGQQPHGRPDPALSFAGVADAYDRARPAYPREAAGWLVGRPRARVLELGAGTGKLTDELVGLGHEVVASDPLGAMLGHLVSRHPRVPAVLAAAERIPLRARSVDVVVSAQAFHWFDADRALPEIARVLRPGGHLALAWNVRDERVPWVKRLGRLVGPPPARDLDPTHVLLSSHLFGFVEQQTFRSWQQLDRARLRDLVLSRSNVAVMGQAERDRVLAEVDALYDGYGRGHDGMLLPYVTHCYKAVVRPPAVDEDDGPVRDDGGDADALLIDFS